MKRLVYTPKINAFVKADSGIYDLSPYITDFSIDRKVNQVSSAKLSFRNPNKMWTSHSYTDPISGEQRVGPIFHPQDPITIFLTRLRNRPIQVFTGYCDSTPYFTLFPGVVQLTASCTLKRLLYTYWDPGLPFVWEFLSEHGWAPNQASGGIVNPAAEQAQKNPTKPRGNDSGIGELLYAVLNEIGGWDDSTIYIEKLPPTIIDLVGHLFDMMKGESQESSDELTSLLHQIIGTSALGSGSPSGGAVDAGGSGPIPETAVTPVDVGRAMLNAGFPRDRTVLAQGMAVVNVESTFGANPDAFKPNSADCVGYWQLQLSTHPVTQAEANDLVKATKFAYTLWKACGGSFKCDWYNFEAGASGTAQAYTSYLPKADQALKLGPFTSSTTSKAQGGIHR